ncbi:TIGR01777 family oxidoreductase [Cellulomonas sp. C5510]|uniref:TIGR01777 family oxidoreductase n=1 Tax=Cellulomonas sp. C5510 TaxID=2871170 RepID=UPI001C9867C9|nr:TIGR01777 family oxidoreductase [Cellulomonas sp. C5510]QZN87102.1 TIGR01777 family oxidoreductase [Cellulomonas sp. C5510]
MIVVVAGSSGLIGTALVARLTAEGHEVRRLVRRPARTPDERTWDPDAGVLPPEALAGADAVVNLAGAGVGDKRLTADRKRVVLESRTRSTGLIASTVAALDDPPRVLLQGSATGAYGERGDDVVTEDEPYGSTFLAGVVRRWEAAAAPAVEHPGVRVVLLRTGIVLSPRGGALGRLLPLVRLGLGGPLGSGRQYWSWITLEDEVRAVLHLLDAPVSGPVNLVAQPATQIEIVRALAARLHRPAVLPVPAWAMRVALGEFSQEVLGSLRAIPDALTAAGFVHLHPTPEAAAAALLP